jgi:hypothetical protein
MPLSRSQQPLLPICIVLLSHELRIQCCLHRLVLTVVRQQLAAPSGTLQD